jgi:hypothetical protein
MNDTISSLLADGRRMLKEQADAAERQRAEHAEKLSRIFLGARTAALKMLNPLGAEFPVEPLSPHEHWDPYTGHGSHRLIFSVRPFGKDAGAITVKVIGAPDPTDHENGPWTWKQDDERWRYHVESQWASNEENDYQYATLFASTNSLAEALAMCERNGETYRKALAGMNQRRAAIAEREARMMLHAQTPEELMTDAMADFVRSIMAASQE